MTRKRSRASSPERAREYRQEGHDRALDFAFLLGLNEDYQNDKRAKKDVIDPSGDAHSIKSGEHRWQIFLYSRRRFETDDGFQALNGVGSLLIHCIDAFPPNYDDYVKDKNPSKERLRTPMRELKDRFQRKALLRAFLMKSMFNGGEVDYLTVYHEEKYHVFLNRDVVRILGKAFTVENSVAGSGGGPPEQKVLFKYEGKNVGELEMRNSSKGHYQEVLFNMIKPRVMDLLFSQIEEVMEYSEEILVYGGAVKKFGNWET